MLAGVDFTSCTPLHFAEEISGKKPFRRWAVYHSNIVETEQGSCSDGFENLRPLLQDLEIKDKVGNCEIRLYEFNKFILKSAQILLQNPTFTICKDFCERCKCMTQGGFLKE